MVRVKASVSEPKYKWGGVTHQMIGKIKSVDGDGDLRVDFSPHHNNWICQAIEMELATIA
jgi:E3 ubiquitin-protein ligase HERC2